ncbi:hypothetical protein [Virgibacillus dokdonensis]|uniref:hypothetical protein n=1 Tax=Virgibacillus dokdonensis TaxID=302167 RepID=UPI0015F27B21|nr:hypothetical protein [Virgibacillus dokdonensis]
MNKPIVYSKREGVNKLIPIDTNDYTSLSKLIEKNYPKEKDFVYVLVDGYEMKLF